MADITNAVNELLKKKRVEENLRVYTRGLSSFYRRMALLRMSMNYYTFSEIYSGYSKDMKSVLENEINRLQALIACELDSDNVNDCEALIEELRNILISKMELMTSYVDRLQIFEYILNRVEYRFKEPDYNEDYYYEKFEKDIAHYITNDKDNTVINMKIGQIVGQLPMRLSKNKFFDIIRDSFSLYKGSEKLSVRDFEYMIRTAGTLYTPTADNTGFNQLEEYLKDFEAADYQSLDENTFNVLREHLDNASILVNDYSDAYVMLTEIVNDLYSLALTGKDTITDVKETKPLYNIISACKLAVDNKEEPDENVGENFIGYEGLQERLGSLIYNPESALNEIIEGNKDAIENSDSKADVDKLVILSRLQSASTFASLRDEEALHEIADEAYIEAETVTIVNEFSELFAKKDRLYRRAVMAGVLSNLPAFFNNMEEFKSYVHIALGQCTDAAEKQCCMSLINMMITSE